MTRSETERAKAVLYEYLSDKCKFVLSELEGFPSDVQEFRYQMAKADQGKFGPIVFRKACEGLSLIEKFQKDALGYLREIGAREKAYRKYDVYDASRRTPVPLTNQNQGKTLHRQHLNLKAFVEKICNAGDEEKGCYLLGISSEKDRMKFSPVSLHIKDKGEEPPMMSDTRGLDEIKNFALSSFKTFMYKELGKEISDYDNSQFFLSVGECRTQMHYDGHFIMYVCLHGKRRWIVGPPWMTEALRIEQKNCSAFDAFNQSDAHIEPLTHFKFLDFTMSPGDVMLLRPGFWHQVASVPDTKTGISSALNYVVSVSDDVIDRSVSVSRTQFINELRYVRNYLGPQNIHIHVNKTKTSSEKDEIDFLAAFEPWYLQKCVTTKW